MKNFILAAAVSACASQAAGCIILADDSAETHAVTASWAVLTGGAPAACPAGVDTARIVLHPTGGGTDLVDLFDCADLEGTATGVPPDQYQIYVELTNRDGTLVNAQSLSQVINVDTADITVTPAFDIHLDQGYFAVAWALTSDGAPTTCGAVAASGVSITSTVTGGTMFFDSAFACENGVGVSDALPAGPYTVSVAATNSQGASLGTAPTLTNKPIKDHNRVTDLGTVTIGIGQFDGN